jgi:predicted dehydrogenase
MSGEVFHGPLLQAHPAFELSMILERSKDKSRLRYPKSTIVRSLDDVLGDANVELVIVNTPHETHFDLTKKALEASKHVVVEKPFSNTVSEGEELIQLAKQKDRMLSVFQNRRWDGDFLTTKKIIESGSLGRLVEFESHYDRYRPVIDASTWKEHTGPGSGILFNLGSHMIDQALSLFGMPEELFAKTGIQRTSGIADDYYDIKLFYKGHSVILKSSYLVRELGPRYLLLGEDGTYVKYGIDPQEQALKEGGTPGSTLWGAEGKDDWGTINTTINGLHLTGAVETIPGNYLGFYDSIFNHLREGKPLEVTAEAGLSVIRVIEASQKSNLEGRVIKM